MEKISRTKIVDLLKREDFGAMVNVKGWVRTRRGSKQVNFIALNDGSTINNVQIVVDLANFDEAVLKDITTGACLSVNGELTESVGAGQKAEIQAREIEVLGACDNTYPLQKKGHSMEASVTTWPSPFTRSSIRRASSISTRPSSRRRTAKVRVRCSR